MEERFYESWKRFFICLGKELKGKKSKKHLVGSEMMFSLANYPQVELEKALDQFSWEHEDGYEKNEIEVTSNEIIWGLQAELDDISNPSVLNKIKKWLFGSKNHYEAINIALKSISDLFKGLPQWIKNVLTLAGELFSLMKIGK